MEPVNTSFHQNRKDTTLWGKHINLGIIGYKIRQVIMHIVSLVELISSTTLRLHILTLIASQNLYYK